MAYFLLLLLLARFCDQEELLIFLGTSIYETISTNSFFSLISTVWVYLLQNLSSCWFVLLIVRLTFFSTMIYCKFHPLVSASWPPHLCSILVYKGHSLLDLQLTYNGLFTALALALSALFLDRLFLRREMIKSVPVVLLYAWIHTACVFL